MSLAEIAEAMQNYMNQFPEVNTLQLEVHNDTHEHEFEHHHAETVTEAFVEAINVMLREKIDSWRVLDNIDDGTFEEALPKLVEFLAINYGK